jgi:hypothetical protein
VAQEAAPDSGDDAGDDASDGGAEASPDAGEDAPDADDGATDGGSDGSPEAGGFHVVAQCQQADYQDLTGVGATRDVSPWDTSLGKRCIKIAAGQTVTWNGGNTLPATPARGDERRRAEPDRQRLAVEPVGGLPDPRRLRLRLRQPPDVHVRRDLGRALKRRLTRGAR